MRRSGEPALFLNQWGQRLGYAGIGQILERRGRQAGIDGLHPHVLRHTWAHHARRAGVNDSEVITAAGWTTGAQLARYGRAGAVQRAREAFHAHPVAGFVRGR
jgi:integrase/recombinase XerD